MRTMLSRLYHAHVLQIAVAVSVLIVAAAYPLDARLKALYTKQFSQEILDRAGNRIALLPNYRGYYAEDIGIVPENVKKILFGKEDRFFYFHPGINPASILRDGIHSAFSSRLRGSSTLTQQLVKNLLGNENRRTIGNKIIETFYTLALELYTPKEKILSMYANSVYLGNQIQGIKEAGRYYYARTPEALNDAQVLALVTTLGNPSVRYPGTISNKIFTALLSDTFGIGKDSAGMKKSEPDGTAAYSTKTDTAFEIGTIDDGCNGTCTLTIDNSLTESLRQMLAGHLASPSFGGVDNGALVVIKLSRDENPNQLLALVGTPDPSASSRGGQINMAVEPRPIGSTAKPFIYAKAFEKGARPYTLVDDREYKYEIGTGFPLYPKNFDGAYHGIVSMHQALSNSLNVPTVRTLDFVGVDNFNAFLSQSLAFTPRQDLSNYELGIALGGLEMDPLTLAYYFTIFPDEGVLKPLEVAADPQPHYITPPMAAPLATPKQVIDAPFIKLVNGILSDRATGVDQFGLASNLNLTQPNYAVKTGTSYDYHDSWAVGYTPDFLVAVWVGNSSNKPIRQLTGQQGAGKIWHDAMEMLFASPYNQKTEFNFGGLRTFDASGTVEYGLPGDNYAALRNLLVDNPLILEPHDGDVFASEPGATVPLRAREQVTWRVDGAVVGEGADLAWTPAPGDHRITAETDQDRKASVSITVTAP